MQVFLPYVFRTEKIGTTGKQVPLHRRKWVPLEGGQKREVTNTNLAISCLKKKSKTSFRSVSTQITKKGDEKKVKYQTIGN